MTSKTQAALELRRALQYFLETLDADTQLDKILEVPSAFPDYRVGKLYREKEIFRWGENTVGDPQLYQVLQEHLSAEEWPPDSSPSLYKAIGLTVEGYPEWVQPLGISDAYNTGDVVGFDGVLYRSLINGNVWSPVDYPAGWEVVQ